MRLLIPILTLLAAVPGTAGANERHLLYVAVPGIRNDGAYGGFGVLVFDIDRAHHFVRRIAVPALGDGKRPQAAKGICASAATGRLYVSTTTTLSCLDLGNDNVVWQKTYEDGCDRMSITPDGKVIYEPTLEGKYWHVIDAADGREITRIVTDSGAHNTIVAADGRHVFLAGLHSPKLGVADTSTNRIERTVGPFAAAIRPFCVNASSTRCYVCVNELLGFEVGDLTSGKKLWRVEVEGFAKGPTMRHGCPSHGVGLTPDEKELWLTDAHNSRLHVFDNTATPPKQVASIALRDQPGWITFSLDGRYAYPSTGDVIDTSGRRIVADLQDETGRPVQSEKLLEIDFDGQKVSRAGDQFGVGRAVAN